MPSPWGGDPELDPEPTEEIMHLTLPGNASVSPSKDWKVLLGRWVSGIPCLACCHYNLRMIDWWIDRISTKVSQACCSKQYCATRTGGMSSSNNKTTDIFFLPFLNVRPCSVLQVNIKLYLAPKQKHRCMLIPGIPPKKNSFCWCPFAVAIRTEKRYVYGVTRCVQMRPATTIIIYKIPSKQPTPLRKAITLMTDPSTCSSDSLASGRSPSRCWNQSGPCAEADVGP